MVVWRNDCGAILRNNIRQHVLARGKRWFAQRNVRAKLFNRRKFCARRVVRHDNVAWKCSLARRVRQRLSMISAGVRGHAGRFGGFRQSTDRVRGAAVFKTSSALKQFALGKHANSSDVRQRVHFKTRRSHRAPMNSRGGGLHIGKRDWQTIHRAQGNLHSWEHA